MLSVIKARVLRQGRWILDGVDWRLREGELGAILGPNGSGKSTLSRLLAGTLWPSEGEVRLRDEEGAWHPAARQKHHVRLVQQGGLLDVDASLNARQVVCTGFFGTLAMYDKPDRAMLQRAGDLLTQVGMRNQAGQAYSTLSSGEKMRVLIARALAVRPRLLILDEPTSGLDLLAREQVMATLQRLMRGEEARRSCVVLISHHVEELPPATANVLLLSHGAVIASGVPRTVLTSRYLSRAYGVRVEVTRRAGRYSTRVHPHAWQKLLCGDAV